MCVCVLMIHIYKKYILRNILNSTEDEGFPPLNECTKKHVKGKNKAGQKG